MNTKTITLALAAMTALSASAIPAKRGVVHSIAQPDGTRLEVSVVGDEHMHYYLTTDQKVVIASDHGLKYASVDADGNLTLSDMLAHNPEERIATERQYIDRIDKATVLKAMTMPAAQRQRAAGKWDGVGKYSSEFPTTGKVKSIIILVEYKDVQFTTPDAGDYFTRQITQEGFSDNGATGSARDYFLATSMGQFDPDFDVYGPVTLPNNMSYYGGNNAWGDDKNPVHMMLHAARILDETVDFSQYDTDGDGKVDNVYIIYAGRGEADGSDPNTVWPHSAEAPNSSSYIFDGVRLCRYACGNEMQSSVLPDGIGTFVHEFSHVLGLPDLYNTEDGYATYTPSTWSVMDQGCYSNNANTPPMYSSYERNAMGWMTESLEILTEPTNGELTNLADSNKAYLIPTDRDNEFFLLENRQQTGWDKYMPYHGMLVWHIDYSASKWNQNIVNNSQSHQYVDLVEACNTTYSQIVYQRRYAFPGTSKVTSFVNGGTPSLESWTGYNPNMDITEITETDGVITFKAAGGVTGIHDLEVSDDISVNGNVISLPASAIVTDLQGRIIARSNGSKLDATIATPGMYIVKTPTTTKKVIVGKFAAR